MNTAEQTLLLLKTHGPQTAQQLSVLLQLSSMGVRRHLEAWQDKGLVLCEDVADKVGRPARHWRLSQAGHARFPDRHADLTVQLIAQVRAHFGEAGLERLIGAREADSIQHYQQASASAGPMLAPVPPPLLARVQALAEARSAEGYMAQAEPRDDGSVLLAEHHCPICAAARSCPSFCQSELALFRRVLGPDCTVERSEHLLSGAHRCAYVITPVR